ncbi:MAG: multidrug transporter [Caldisericia bacterium]
MIFIYIFLIILSALFVSIAQVLFKKEAKQKITNIKNLIDFAKNKTFIYGASLYLLSLIIYLFSLKHLPLSVGYPLFASSFLFITLFSYLKFKETITKRRIAGVLFIIIGIIIISLTL